MLPPLPSGMHRADRFMGIGLTVAELADSAGHSLAAAYCTQHGHKILEEGRWVVPCKACKSWALSAIHDALAVRTMQDQPTAKGRAR